MIDDPRVVDAAGRSSRPGAYYFRLSILSYFFPLWLGDELGTGADVFNYVAAGSALLVALTAPFFGAVADLKQRRLPFLVGLTVLGVLAAVALFVAANVAYQSALVFYDALLPGVSAGRGGCRGHHLPHPAAIVLHLRRGSHDIFVVIEEPIPESQQSGHANLATMALVASFAVMMALDVAFG